MKQIKQFAAHNFQARSSLHNNMTCDLESHAIAIKRFGVWRDNHTCGVFFSDKPEYAVYIGPEKPSMPNNDSFQNVPKLSVLCVFSAARSIAWSIDFQFMKATFNDVNTSKCPGFNTKMACGAGKSLNVIMNLTFLTMNLTMNLTTIRRLTDGSISYDGSFRRSDPANWSSMSTLHCHHKPSTALLNSSRYWWAHPQKYSSVII